MKNNEQFRIAAASYSKPIEDSGMSEEAALRIFNASDAESIAVVRNWYILYMPFGEAHADSPKLRGLKPFRLTALEIIADRTGRFSAGR